MLDIEKDVGHRVVPLVACADCDDPMLDDSSGGWKAIRGEDRPPTLTPGSRCRTIQSLADMGYVVDITQADAYTLGNPSGVRAPSSAPVLHLKDDILRIPIKLIDRNGRIVRVVDP